MSFRTYNYLAGVDAGFGFLFALDPHRPGTTQYGRSASITHAS
jgi:hypothetical protein